MARQVQFDGEWCLAGDFNMVQSRQDKTGPSSILAGGERNKWSTLEDKWSLVDAWKLGPWKDDTGFAFHSL